MNQKQLVQQMDLKNIIISVMDKFKLVFIGVIALLTLASCTSDYYYDDYYHDIPTPEIMIGKWVNQDYTSPYKEVYLYRNGTYNVRYHSSILSTTFTGRWYYRDRYLYFAGEIKDKLYIYSLEYPHIYFSNGSVWRKIRVEGC